MKLRRFLPLLLALAVASCASPEKLAQRSEEELEAGNPQDAYDDAVKALHKEPGFERARRDAAAAAAKLVEQRLEEVLAVAQLRDTLGAGDALIRLDQFRRQVTDLHVPLPQDSLFSLPESTVRYAAAALRYNRGQADLKDEPRRAYTEFQAAHDLVPDYKDVGARVHEAYSKAVVRIAVLPWVNETDQENLAKELSDHMYNELSRRVNAQDYPFTVLIDRARVNAKVTVEDLEHLDRDAAIRIGRAVGANRVLLGRVYGLHTDTNTDSYTFPLWHKVTATDDKGQSTSHWDSENMGCSLRSRTVTVSYGFDILDVVSGRVLDSHTYASSAEAHTFYTDFVPDEDGRDYSLVPPESGGEDSDRASELRQNWKTRMGTWGLGEALHKVSTDHSARATYQRKFRGDFRADSRQRPVFLGEVPPAGDLALIALDQSWQTVLGSLKDLEKSAN